MNPLIDETNKGLLLATAITINSFPLYRPRFELLIVMDDFFLLFESPILATPFYVALYTSLFFNIPRHPPRMLTRLDCNPVTICDAPSSLTCLGPLLPG